MIFVSTGTQKFPFDRLLVAVDHCIEAGVIEEEVFAQTGASAYTPLHYGFSPFLDQDKYKEKMAAADLVITHAGTGAIVSALKKGKTVIAVPRYRKYGEHVDNHQAQILKAFEQMGYIEACYHTEDLADAIRAAHSKTYKPYISNTAHFITDLENYLTSV